MDALKAFLNLLIKYDALQHYQQKMLAGRLLAGTSIFLATGVPILARGSGRRGGVGLAPLQNKDPKLDIFRPTFFVNSCSI